jgi:hypothetical protein
VAIAVPSDGERSLEEMALCFAAEFIAMGWSDQAIRDMFQRPFYHGPHTVYQKKGIAFVDEVIRQAKEEHQRRLERFSLPRKQNRR